MAGKSKKPKKGTRAARSRRGKGQAFTAAKENEVEVRKVAIGDNSGDLPLIEPDDLLHHKKTIAGWREKVSTAQSHLRNAIKSAKKAGVDMEALNLVVGIERTNDPAKALNFFRQVDLGLEHGESTLRLTVHDTLAGDEMQLVYKRGFMDGKAGRTADSKYPEGSDLAEEYARGWRHGTASNLGISPNDSDKAYAEGEEERKAA